MTSARAVAGTITLALTCIAFGFGVGRLGGQTQGQAFAGTVTASRSGLLVQTPAAPGAALLNDPRELIPLGPGKSGSTGGAKGTTCPLYIMQDGKLYQLPGGQPQPGGRPGQTPELVPLQPGSPSTPQPGQTPQPATPDPTTPSTVPSTKS